MSKITVMLVDDHPIFRQGIRRVLEHASDLEVVAEAAEGEMAIRLAAELQPQLVIIDINLPQLNGLQVTQKLKHLLPKVSIIVLTGYYDHEQLIYALQAGANGCLSKDVTPEFLLTAIQQVVQGKFVIVDQFMTKAKALIWLAQQTNHLNHSLTINPLSNREMEILHLVAHANSNKQIAATLGLSEQTIKNHLNRVQRKLGVHDRTQIVLYALRKGWITLHE